jgi:hypothetical protein
MTTVTGPSSSTVGNIAFFDNTSGSSIGAAPAFQSGNPGNAAIYSTLANPANGSTILNNAMQVSLGTPLDAAHQFGVNIAGVQQTVVGTLSIASGDSIIQGNAIAGYADTESSTNSPFATPPAAVGVFGQASMGVAGANVFGGDLIAENITGSNITGRDANFMAGLETDTNMWKVSGGADPAINGDNAYGVFVSGGGNFTGSIGSGIGILSPSTAGGKWNHGIRTLPGAAVNALSVGPAGAGSNQPSQFVIYQSVDVGGVPRTATTFCDQNGSYYIAPSASAAVDIEDGNGNVLIETLAGLGGSHVRLPALTSAGVVTNDASGVLSSSTTLPSGLTLSGITTTQGSIVPSLSAGTPIIDSSGTTISLGAGASGLIANNVACEIAIREASLTGELAKFLLGPFGVGKLVAQSGSGWSLGTSPPSTGFSIGYDGGSNTWKLYNGSGAARAYSFALTRFG